MYSIGVDIGGSHISSCMFEHSDKRLLLESMVCLPVDNKGSIEEILSVWIQAIRQTITISKVKFQGIGIAIPGPFDYINGISLISGVQKYEALYNVNVRAELSEQLDIPASEIYFINDAMAFGVAESTIGTTSNYNRVVAITLGTGLGATFCISGVPYIEGEGVPQNGILFEKQYKGQLADEFFSTRGIINHYKSISGEKVGSVLELSNKISSDSNAMATFIWFGKELGTFLQPFLDSFGAEVLVLGGNISKSFELFEESLKSQVNDIPICISTQTEESAILGAAMYYQLKHHFAV
ncbi:ROK family protein [Belliella sp. DSM 111904]|uniref:ROK family protein n=1 Tax=Belliella filtrata TaxID=2923435 RepID=A0ABS9UY47_9BACT|nr:ROK family protein [Belliella filtrata]MCH7409092.1 ROK family protein [Belliella filtrata]